MKIPATINDFISMRDTFKISQDKLKKSCYIYNENSDEYLKMPYSPLINKYKEFFDSISAKIPLNDDDYKKYKFSPKRVSLDIYGTTELWSVILYINNCKSVIDFDLHTIKLLFPDKVNDMINEIFIFENE